MKSVFLTTILFLVGCSEPPSVVHTNSEYIIDKKYCISECMRHEFRMFHNEGESWGTGSSSMNGLSQSKIYDRVKSECVSFYSNEQCCRVPSIYDNNKILKTHIHGYEFGVCNL